MMKYLTYPMLHSRNRLELNKCVNEMLHGKTKSDL